MGGGLAGGGTGGSPGGGAAGGTPGCVRDQDCGAISGCSAPKCQLNGQCSTVPVDGGVLCRAAAGVCDVDERCTGVSTLCPMDSLRTTSTVCSPAVGLCEADAVCDGLTVNCPARRLRDAGTVCAQPACLPPIVCSGSSVMCTGPADAGQLCDDRNVCSVDTCVSGASCSWMVEPNITSRALLGTFADAGVLRLALPQVATTIGTPFGNSTLTMCPNGAQFASAPPECMLEVSLTNPTFMTTRSPTQFVGTGSVMIRAQLLPLRMPIPSLGTSNGGSMIGLGGCSGGLPAQPVGPVGVLVNYGFQIDEPAGGLVTLLPFMSIEMPLRNQLTTCLPGTVTSLGLQGAIESAIADAVAPAADQLVQNAFTASLMQQLCLHTSDAGTCQVGTPMNGLCMTGARCYSARHFRTPVPTIPACVR